jgi:hypothetical protein
MVLGRRATGVTHARAERGATLVLQQVQQRSVRRIPNDWPRTIRLIGTSHGLSRLRSQYEASLRLLMGVVVIVMLIACASITTLMMTRSTARRREMAVRLTLGASRARLVRQLLTEGALLSFAAGRSVFSSRGGAAAVHFYQPRVPLSVDESDAFNRSRRPFMLAPSLRGPCASVDTPRLGAPSGGSDSTSARMRRISGRKILVTVQVALSLVLVIGALLAPVLRTLPGYRPASRRTKPSPRRSTLR